MLVKLKEVFTRFEIKSKSQSPFYITTLEQKISGSSIKYSGIILYLAGKNWPENTDL